MEAVLEVKSLGDDTSLTEQTGGIQVGERLSYDDHRPLMPFFASGWKGQGHIEQVEAR